jgi:hypothetical protein
MALPDYVKNAVAQNEGLPDYVRKAVGKTEQPQEEPEMGWGEVGSEALSNIPESASRLAGDIYQAVRHPVETGKAVVGLARGVAQKAIPGEQPQEKYADAMGEFIKERYGSVEALKQTIAEDPVGALADIATVFTVAGGTIKMAGKAAKTGRAVKVGETLGKIGAAVEPLNIAAKVGVGALKGVPKFVPERIYERVAKMSTTMKPKDRIAAVRTALDEGIMPTPEGVDVLWDKVKTIEKSVDDVINQAPDSPIQTGDIARTLEQVRKDFANDPFARKFLKDIDKLEVEFMRKGDTVTAKEAQAIKKRAYKTIRKAYDKELTTVGEETRMAVARGIREEMTMLFPELKTLGKEEGALINLEKAIKGSVGRIGNHDLFSLTSLLAGGGVGAAAQSPIAGIGTMAVVQVIKNPKVQAKLAIALRKAKKAKISDVKVKGTGARLGAAQAGRTSNEE